VSLKYGAIIDTFVPHNYEDVSKLLHIKPTYLMQVIIRYVYMAAFIFILLHIKYSTQDIECKPKIHDVFLFSYPQTI